MVSCFHIISCSARTPAFLPEISISQTSLPRNPSPRILDPSIVHLTGNPSMASEQHMFILFPSISHNEPNDPNFDSRRNPPSPQPPHSPSTTTTAPTDSLSLNFLSFFTLHCPHNKQYPSMGNQRSSISTRTIRRMGED